MGRGPGAAGPLPTRHLPLVSPWGPDASGFFPRISHASGVTGSNVHPRILYEIPKVIYGPRVVTRELTLPDPPRFRRTPSNLAGPHLIPPHWQTLTHLPPLTYSPHELWSL